MLPLLLPLPDLLLCFFEGGGGGSTIELTARWTYSLGMKPTPSCLLSFRVSQSPVNVHLIILFRERQACGALVWCCWEWGSFLISLLTLTRLTACGARFLFKLHLDGGGGGIWCQTTCCNWGCRQRAEQPSHRKNVITTSSFNCIEVYFFLKLAVENPSRRIWILKGH